MIVALVEQIVAVVKQQHVTRVIDERVVGDATDSAQQRHNTHGVLVVPLEPVVAHLTTTITRVSETIREALSSPNIKLHYEKNRRRTNEQTDEQTNRTSRKATAFVSAALIIRR